VTTTETSVGLRRFASAHRWPSARSATISEELWRLEQIRSEEGLAVGLSGRGPPNPGSYVEYQVGDQIRSWCSAATTG